MAQAAVLAPWEDPKLRAVTGSTLRPGGFALTDRAAHMAGLAPGWTVLDIGAGTGATVGRLRSRYGAQAFGVELSRHQLSTPAQPGLPMARAQAQNLPVRDGCLDMVFCECVLSLVPSPKQALHEFARILAPGGALALMDLCLRSGQQVTSNTNSCAGGAKSIHTMKAFVQDAGLSIERVEDHTSLLKDLAARLILSGSGTPGCDCNAPRGYFMLMARKPGAHT